MINTIQSYLSKQKDEYSKIEADLGHTMLTTDYRGENIANYHRQSSDYTSFTQSQSITIVSLKRYLENLVEVGHELGLAGLYLFAKELRRKLKLPQTRLSIPNPSARELFEDVFQRLECLVDDILEPLYQSNVTFEILFSPKVIKLVERIVEQQEIKGSNSKCIVFVERVYTATMLSQVLSDFIPCLESPWDTQLKAKHITGIKAIFSDKPMTAKYQVRISLY
jgi:ERCC4-related helicase